MKTLKFLSFFLLISFIPILMVCVYIYRTYINTTFLDGFIFVPLAGAVKNGSWSFADLFARFGEHLLVGYGIINAVNAKVFSLDMRLDPILFLFSYVTLCWIIYNECVKIFSNNTKSLFYLFFPLALLCYSLVAPPMIWMTTQFTWGTTLAIFIAYIIQKDFDNDKHQFPYSNQIILLISICMYFLIFSGGYFPGLLAGMFFMYASKWLIERNKFNLRNYGVLGLAIICTAIYSYSMLTKSAMPEEVSLDKKLSNFFAKPVETCLFYLAGVGCSVMAGHTIENHAYYILIIGVIMAGALILSLWLYISTEMYRYTYIPIFLIGYSFGVITAVRIGRGLLGDWRWITSDWYAFHLRPFVLGITWIICYGLIYLSQKPVLSRYKLIILKTSAALMLIFIFSCQIISNTYQWKLGPYIKLWMAEKRKALRFPEFTDQSLLLWNPAAVEKDRIILKANHLSCFSDPNWSDLSGGKINTLAYLSGWYEDGWIDHEATSVFQSNKIENIFFQGYVPKFVVGNHITVLINSRIIFDKDVPPGGVVNFYSQVNSGINVISIHCSKAIIPSQQPKLGADQRSLSFHFNSIKFGD